MVKDKLKIQNLIACVPWTERSKKKKKKSLSVTETMVKNTHY